MDKQRAKFILQSFRPDGADAKDPAFAEALTLAAEDRELGEWLAKERAQDAAFAMALSDLPIPEDLREAVFEVLGSGEQEITDFDAGFVGALAAVRPPEGLRDQILDAMDVEKKVVEMPKRSSFWKWSTSAAAALAMMAVFGFFVFSGGNALAGSNTKEVEYSAIEMLESPFFSLDLTNDRQAVLYEWLEGQDLPSPEAIPEGLRSLKGVGCKFLEVGEKKSRASLVCYRKADDTIVHLVMMKKEDLDTADLPQIENAVDGCRGCDRNDKWAVSQWSDAEHAFLMLSKMEASEMKALF